MSRGKFKQKLNFAEKAYKSTQIDFNQTQGKITTMLEELNINKVRFTKDGSDYQIEFIVKLSNEEAPSKVRVLLPFPSELGETSKQEIQRRNKLFRVAFYHLKNRFVAVANHVREFHEEFAMDIVVTVNGVEQRLGDMVVPEIRRQLKLDDRVILSINPERK